MAIPLGRGVHFCIDCQLAMFSWVVLQELLGVIENKKPALLKIKAQNTSDVAIFFIKKQSKNDNYRFYTMI